MVSGSISLPFRGTFHLSLTVLVHYRSTKVFSLASWSLQIPTEFHVFRCTQEIMWKIIRFYIQGFYLLWLVFPDHSTIKWFCDFHVHPQLHIMIPITPIEQRLRALASNRFGLLPVRSPLLGQSLVWFLFLGLLRCFSSPGLPYCPIYSDNNSIR
jgi:hypothetical protein